MTRDRALELAEVLVHEQRAAMRACGSTSLVSWDDVATHIADVREEEPPPALLLEHIATELRTISFLKGINRLTQIADTLEKVVQ